MNKLQIVEKKINEITSLELLEQINIFRKQENKKEQSHSDLLKIIRDEFEDEIDIENEENIVVLNEEAGSRIDKFLSEKLELTRTRIQQLIKDEKEAINKQILDKKDSIYSFFILTENPSRYYPENEVAAQVV